MKVHRFLNLTNGIEAAPHLDDDWQVVRIRSTAIEKRDWATLLGDLDHNLLFWLARGHICAIYDFGAGRRPSKVTRLGVPLIRAVLSGCWFDGRDHRVDPMRVMADEIGSMMNRATTELAKRAKEKLRYYRSFLDTDVVRLRGIGATTQHDGDLAYYRAALAENEAGDTVKAEGRA